MMDLNKPIKFRLEAFSWTRCNKAIEPIVRVKRAFCLYFASVLEMTQNKGLTVLPDTKIHGWLSSTCECKHEHKSLYNKDLCEL